MLHHLLSRLRDLLRHALLLLLPLLLLVVPLGCAQATVLPAAHARRRSSWRRGVSSILHLLAGAAPV